MASPLSSSSTFSEIEAEYLDTAKYLESESRALALRHAIAIRFLLVKLPSSSTKGANSVGYSMSLLQEELKKAEDYAKAMELAASQNGSSFLRADLSKMRSYG